MTTTTADLARAADLDARAARIRALSDTLSKDDECHARKAFDALSAYGHAYDAMSPAGRAVLLAMTRASCGEYAD